MPGGLDHLLADTFTITGDREAEYAARKDRRILLALSWLSVEDKCGAPQQHVIVEGNQADSVRKSRIIAALHGILHKRGLAEPEIESWIQDCAVSLEAAIREDAAWVDRSAAFDALATTWGSCPTRAEAHAVFESLRGSLEQFFSPIDLTADAGDEAADFAIKAGNWLSTYWGSGKKSDSQQVGKNLKLLAAAARQTVDASPIKRLELMVQQLCLPTGSNIEKLGKSVGWKGRPSSGKMALLRLLGSEALTPQQVQEAIDKIEAEATSFLQEQTTATLSWAAALRAELKDATGFDYRTAKDHTWEYAVMLDHALRRVSSAATWRKRAEAERRQFVEDQRKGESVPSETRKYLDQLCTDRGTASGALGEYYIRRRAVQGWKEVLNKWSRTECATTKDRIAAAREVQADDEIEKFGDIQLFEWLANDDALCVWKTNGEVNTEWLLSYAAASDAANKMRRFKVPCYCHPDALAHPVFCDFGNSRWHIRFAVHDRITRLNDAQTTLVRRQAELKKANDRLDAAKSPEKQTLARATIDASSIALREAQSRIDFLTNQHALEMGLWADESIKYDFHLAWSSKRLSRDLGLDVPAGAPATEVTRADRLGRAVAGITSHQNARPIGLFEMDDWNGRLQAPRTQLDTLAEYVQSKGWDDIARKMRDRIQWLISFSAKLQPTGPFLKYAPTVGIIPNRKGEFYPHAEVNKERLGMSKLILCRLPGLRLLSVDLGHRYAAACAVWECVSQEQVEKTCHDAGTQPPDANALFLHLKHNGKKIVYRRIGFDRIAGDKLHPAPWARLDRQFLIKLQGEDHAARRASRQEILAIEEFEQSIGRLPPQKRKLSVDEMMSAAVQMARLALRRHADRARIANSLITIERPLSGGRTEKFTELTHIAFLTDMLQIWYDLASSDRWSDPHARQLWYRYIVEELNGPKLPEHIEENETFHIRKQRKEKLRIELVPIAKLIANRDRMKLHVTWATRWREDNEAWRKHLRWLRDWILPRGSKSKNCAIRNVGGLSLDRIATIKSLYQVQKAFFTRFTPEGRQMEKDSRGKPITKPVTADVGFGRSVLESMERMRDNRVKQLASRIAAAALGLGIDLKPRPNDPRFSACHAVVIENLTRYRPEETRTRRENRQLMTWSSSKVKKYLYEACQLNGLYLREVSAGYTSRQDSRTGVGGIRCSDVHPRDFITSPWWRKQVNAAQDDDGDARTRLLVDLDRYWSERWPKMTEAERKVARPLRLPVNGGEIFISADSHSPTANGLQADLNAAANIGLKAILDPDWPGKWWYIPCSSNRFPLEKSTKGSTVIDLKQPLPPLKVNDEISKTMNRRAKKKSSGNADQPINLWSDVSCQVPTVREWKNYTEYQNGVRYKAIQILRRYNGL